MPGLNRHTKFDNPLDALTPEQLQQIAAEFDAIGAAVRADLGARDARYIRRVIGFERRLSVASRALLLASRWKPAWFLGTAGLALAKVLENMEVGHNVMHGQWDWMHDPEINSTVWDWDNVSPAAAWKHSHNYLHHTWTNVLGRDRDVGYDLLRVDPRQRWKPKHLTQPVSNLLLMAFFEWGVASHDLDFRAVAYGRKPKRQFLDELRQVGAKAGRQVTKDYLLWPVLAGRRGFARAAAGAFVANIVRNVWAHAIIFCGHFPDQAYTFTEDEVAEETRGQWYVRQLLGSANIDGRPLFHLLAGNLSHQVEHHLFPDIPSSRHAELRPQVKAVCEKYGLPYNTGPFLRQWLTVQRTILRLAFPGGEQRPKAAPFVADAETAPATVADLPVPVSDPCVA